MLKQKTRFPISETIDVPDSGIFLIGHIVDRNDTRILIDYPGNLHGVLPARSAVAIPKSHERKSSIPLQVILVFENGDISLPFIIGIINSEQQLLNKKKVIKDPIDHEKNLVIESDTLILSGREKVTLQCGKGSITLKKDGKIIIKGVELVSRASESNKIKGCTVSVN